MTTPYKLYYHNMIPGRGDFIRMVLELKEIPYEDVCRGPAGNEAIAKAKTAIPGIVHYAPPILQVSDELSLSMTPVILAYLARKHGLMPENEKDQYAAIQIDNFVHDIVGEVHATHHPVDVTASYEDQLPEAKRAATVVTQLRLPRLFDHLEKTVTAHNDGSGVYIFGSKISYPDVSITYMMRGVAFAFPKTYERITQSTPRLLALKQTVENIPSVAAYLKSDRCLPFSGGIFRNYPEQQE